MADNKPQKREETESPMTRQTQRKRQFVRNRKSEQKMKKSTESRWRNKGTSWLAGVAALAIFLVLPGLALAIEVPPDGAELTAPQQMNAETPVDTTYAASPSETAAVTDVGLLVPMFAVVNASAPAAIDCVGETPFEENMALTASFSRSDTPVVLHAVHWTAWRNSTALGTERDFKMAADFDPAAALGLGLDAASGMDFRALA